MRPHPPTTGESLRRRFKFDDEEDDPPTIVPFAAVAATRSDPGRILSYLDQLGCPVSTLDELHQTITTLNDEELASFELTDGGVAVTVASDGTWFLFKP